MANYIGGYAAKPGDYVTWSGIFTDSNGNKGQLGLGIVEEWRNNTQIAYHVELWYYCLNQVDDITNTFTVWITNGNTITGTNYGLDNTGSGSGSVYWHIMNSESITYNRGGAYVEASGSFSGLQWGGGSGSYSRSWYTPAVESFWNDINAYYPDGSTQGALKFNLSTSDGSNWSGLTNEPDGFTKAAGTTATISGVTNAVTGLHYTGNNVTNNAASSFTWTFSSANWVCCLYTAWNTYTVSYNGNGNTGGSTASTGHTYNTAKALATNGFTRTGYTFKQWNTKSDGSGTAYTSGQSVSNLTSTNGGTVTLYAIWTANTYTVTYNGNGYTGGSTASTTHTYGVAKALATNGFTRTGYTFSKWNTKSDGSGTSYTSGQSVSNLTSTSGGTVTLYAIWTVNKYYIDVNGLLDGSDISSISGYGTFDITVAGTKVGEDINDYYTQHNYGSSYSISDVKAVTGKTYNGVSSGSLTGTIGTSGINVRLKFTTNTYTIAYNANGGSGAPSSQTKTYGTSLTLSTTIPTYVGYTFLGWSTNPTATSATYAAGATLSSDLTTTNGATVTLYAVWKATAPYNLGINFVSATDTSITIKCSCESRVDGLTWTAYYTGGGQLKYSTSSTTSGSLRECSLMLAERNYVLEDRNYNIYFTVTNSTGTTTSNTVTYSTTLGALTASQILTTDVTPFTIKVSMNEGTTTHPTKDKYWLYSCDGGVTWRQKMGNLFNIQKWIDHVPTVYADDTCSVDTNGVTITAVNSADAYTHTMHWTTSGNIVSARDIARVGIYGTPCVGGLTYALAYTPSNSTSKTQAYIHFYDEDFCVINYPGLNSATSTSRRVFTTTAPSNARWMSVRFDNDTQNSTVTFKDIYLGLDTTGTYVPYEEDSGSYEFTGLEEETTYVIQGMLSVMNDGVTSYPKVIMHPAITITTPADQARIQVKIEGVWQKGKTYFKKDGEWVKAKKIYIKKDGVWVLGSNNGS